MQASFLIRIVATVFSITLLYNSGEVSAMEFLKQCLFSPVEGVVTIDGRPSSDAIIKKKYSWGNKKETKETETKTDINGSFEFDASYSSSVFTSLFPHEPLITQYIYIEHNQKSYLGWRYEKGSYDIGAETGKSPIKLICDLMWEEQFHNDDNPLRRYLGICRVLE